MAAINLLCLLFPTLVSASVGNFRWSTPYPDGRTQDLLSVVSPTEFFMAAKKISGINHYNNGAWSWIPPPPWIDANSRARCIGSRYSGGKVMVVLEGHPAIFAEYSLGAKSWSKQPLLVLQTGGNMACFMTNNALFIVGNEAAVYDLGVSITLRPSTNLCNVADPSGCFLIAGNGQVVYTFAGNASNNHLLKYESPDWTDVGQVNTTVSLVESLTLAADGTLYVAGHGVLAKSKDKGKNWTRLALVNSACEGTCNQAVYAANDVVLLGSFEASGLYAYNLSSGEYPQRTFEGRAVVASGIANTAFVMGAYGSVWQTAMIADLSTPLNPLTKGFLIDYSPSEGEADVCQVKGISGSVANGKVYAVTSGCGSTVGSVYTVSLPAASAWTRFGPPDVNLNFKGIFALPLSDDIWIYSYLGVGRYHDGTWTVAYMGGIVAIHGYQTSAGSSTVIAVTDNSIMKATGVSTAFTFISALCNPLGDFLSALHVSNVTTYFVGAGSTIAVTADGGLNAVWGDNPISNVTVRAIYYRRSADIILVANARGLWVSIGGAGVQSRSWTLALSADGPLDGAFDFIWARDENDIYASGETQDVIWHFTNGTFWTQIMTPLDHDDTWLADTAHPTFGVRGVWGTPLGDTYAGTHVGVISSPVDTLSPTRAPSQFPTPVPTPSSAAPTIPTGFPSRMPTSSPSTISPTRSPITHSPTPRPTRLPTRAPTRRPTKSPITQGPSRVPTRRPSESPTVLPTGSPSFSPTPGPTKAPSFSPTIRVCVCSDDCEYKGIALGNNGVCEDAGVGGNGYEHPELAACMFGHDCADCGTSNRTAFMNPISCDPNVKRRVFSGSSQHSLLLPFLCVFVVFIL